MDQTVEQFVGLLEEKGIRLEPYQLDQFESYYKELVEWNEKMNLTAITDRPQVYLKHFYDSLTLSLYVPMGDVKTMADIGAGAGFPSLPIKIAFPHLQLTIVDSLNKRIQFLQHVVGKLELKDVRCIHGRAEEAGRNTELRDAFDLVTARAVARLNVLNELCLPFVRKGGLFAAMKGAHSAEELDEATKSIRVLNGQLKSSNRFDLPVEHSERHIIVIEKTGATPPKYPRKPGTPSKDPIQ